ncbi:MAG: hypothetical protein ACXAAH_11540 [Promethearchaeota archaeon]|jgi:hypothetical protein
MQVFFYIIKYVLIIGLGLFLTKFDRNDAYIIVGFILAVELFNRIIEVNFYKED